MNLAKALFLALLLAACGRVTIATETSVVAPLDNPVDNGTVVPTAEQAPTEIEAPVSSSTPEPVIQRTSWLLLGGDYRAHREDTGYGDKTDVIVLVSVLESDPVEISVVQFPRNLYVSTSLEDQFLFAVWGREGWQGLHSWFQEAMGISLQGIFYVDMDGFVQIVDEMGGIRVRDSGGAYQLGGEDALDYLRDNENNWGMGSYDAEERVFTVLKALWSQGRGYFLSDPIEAVDAVFSRWGDYFKTELSNQNQLYWLFRLGWKVRTSDTSYSWVQLEEPYIIRGDTPLDVRGMIPNLEMLPRTYSLYAWWVVCVEEWSCEDG